MREARARSSGFTLLELIVVLAVAALVLAVAVPTIGSGGGRPELLAAARELASELRLARSRAIAENRPAAVVVDTAGASYGAAEPATPRPLPRGMQLTLITTADQAAGSSGAIRFYPDGSASGGGITLAREGLRYDVLVNWLNGGVSIHDRSEAPPR